MATKKQQLDAKLGSWTEQANLTKGQSQAPAQEVTTSVSDRPPVRAVYATERGLLDRVNGLAASHGLTQNEVIGRLLTWALDQADAGIYQLS